MRNDGPRANTLTSPLYAAPFSLPVTVPSLSMKISEYILHINSPPRLLFLGRFVGGRHVARLGLSAFSYAQKKSRSLRATCERETLHNGANGVKGDDEKPEIVCVE